MPLADQLMQHLLADKYKETCYDNEIAQRVLEIVS